MNITITLGELLFLLVLGFVIMPLVGAYVGFKIGLCIDILDDDEEDDENENEDDWKGETKL